MNTFAPKSESDRTRPRSTMTGDAGRNGAPAGGGNRLQETFDRSPRVVGQMKLARALSGRAKAPVQRQAVVQRVQLPTDRTDQIIRFLVFRGGVNYDDAVAMSKTQLIEEFQQRTQGREDEVLNYLLGEQGFDNYGEMDEEQKLEKFKELVPGDTGTGLAEDKILTRYAKDVAGIDPAEWSQDDPDKKVRILVEYVNDALTKTGTPPVKFDFQKFAPDTNAIFDHETWKISFNELTFDPKHPNYSELSLGKVMNTAYHEARHAQQWYRVATLLAGDGFDAQTIGQKTGIKVERVLQFAEAHPLKRTAGVLPDVQEGLEWEESFTGPKSVQNRETKLNLFLTERKIGELSHQREQARSGFLVAEQEQAELGNKLKDFKSLEATFDRATRNLALWRTISRENTGWAAKFDKFQKTMETDPTLVFDEALESELGIDESSLPSQPTQITKADWVAEGRFQQDEIKEAARKLQAYQEENRLDPWDAQEQRFHLEYAAFMEKFKELSHQLAGLQGPYEFLYHQYKGFEEEHDAFDIGDLAQQKYGELIQKKAAPGNVVQKVDLSQEGNRQLLLQTIQEAEDDSLFSSGVAEQARLYLASLGETELEETGRAVDAVERQVDVDEDLEHEQTRSDETTQKILLSKARLLVKLATGELTPKGLNQEAEVFGQNLLAKSDIEDLAESALDEEDSVEKVKAKFSGELDESSLVPLAGDLEPFFADFPKGNLKPLIELNKKVLVSSDPYGRLRKLLPKIKETVAAIRESGNPNAEGVIKQFKTWLLAEVFSGETSFHTLEGIIEEKANGFIAEKRSFIEGKSPFLVNPERTPGEVQGAIGEDLKNRQVTGHQKAVEQQEQDRTRLREFIVNGAETATVGSPFRNACEWLLSGRSKLYALTRTHDSETRPLVHGSTRTESWFPKWTTGLGDVFSGATDYSNTDNDNVLFATHNTLGGSTPDGSVVIHGASQMSDEELRRTIVHEVQHSSDLHEMTPLARFQSEVNAYLLGHEQHPEEFLANKEAGGTAEGEGGTWNARVKAIFDHMRASGGYDYLREAWEANQDDFKGKVRAIQGPQTPNPINSVRIADFNKAVIEGGNIGLAYEHLNEHDRAAMKGNPAILALIAKHLQDAQLEQYTLLFQ